jgi:hypothetical protein
MDARSTALSYEPPGGLIVEVRPDGVLLRLPKPSAAKEVASAIFSLLLNAAILIELFLSLSASMRASVSYPPSLFWSTVALLIVTAAVGVTQLFAAFRTFARLAKRNQLSGTHFFAAADQPATGGVDPV